MTGSTATKRAPGVIGKAAWAQAAESFRRVRHHSMALVAPLSAEDCQVQSMPDASPAKWHLGHTTWFFETFILAPHVRGYMPFDPAFRVIYNSYYNTVGDKHPRPERGLLSRPSLDRVRAYRAHVDAAMLALLADQTQATTAPPSGLLALLTLGLNHEQQHQELLLTDVKHMLSVNPLYPAYSASDDAAPSAIPQNPAPGTTATLATAWTEFTGGLVEIGHDASESPAFAFDNESPRHQVFLRPYQLANRLVSNRDFLAFIADGGYRRHELWLSDGWDRVTREGWQAPFYWRRNDEAGFNANRHDGAWCEFTLRGLVALDLDAPACHLSFFEADAYARWAGARLPTEAEWEHAAARAPVVANEGSLHPAAPSGTGLAQMFGTVWQWTASAYLGYPGFVTAEGAVGEYNGKFMCNQFVLRGSSVATPAGHARCTYRNFFQPEKRWQFSGLRLAKSL